MAACSHMNGLGKPKVEMDIAEFDSSWGMLRQNCVEVMDCVVNSHDIAISASAYAFFQVRSIL